MANWGQRRGARPVTEGEKMRQLDGPGRRRRLRLGAAVLVCAIAGAALAGVASARLTTYRTNLFFDRAVKSGPTQAKFVGHITSPRTTCKKNREVQIFDLTAGDVRIDKARSNASGDWATAKAAPAKGHQLYALVEAKYFDNGNKRCNVDQTTSRAYPFP